MPDFTALVKSISDDSLKVAAAICDAQAVGLTFLLTQVDEGPKICLTPEQLKQVQLVAKIEMARELGAQIRGLAK